MASIEKVPGGYRVRWREGGSGRAKFATRVGRGRPVDVLAYIDAALARPKPTRGRNRAYYTGPLKQDAVDYMLEVERAKRMGTLSRLNMGDDLFVDFVERDYWPRHASSLAREWQVTMASSLDKHIAPTFAAMKLKEITLADIDEWLAQMRRDGVGTRAQQIAHQVLGQILAKAVRWEKLASNPAALADKPKHKSKPIVPPTPLEVERVRDRLVEQGRPGDAVLVSVLAYAGLRPQEALALTWDSIRDRTLLVGPEHKTGHRSVDLWAPLSRDLSVWRLAMGGRRHLIFPTHSGRPWTKSNWSNWGRRIWANKQKDKKTGEVVWKGAGIEGTTPYALRHTHCSLMIREDKLSLTEQAAQAGHSIQVHLDTYAHLFSELKGKGSAEDAIREARAKVNEQREAM